MAKRKTGRKLATKGDGELNDRQRAFALVFPTLRNATAAAVSVGYSPKTASVQGHALLRKPKIRALINEAIQQSEQRLDLTLDKLLAEAAALATSDMRDYIGKDGRFLEPSEWSARAAKCVQRYEVTETGVGKDYRRTVKITLWNKISALQLIADLKHLRSDHLTIEAGGTWREVLEKMWERNRPGGTGS